MTKCIDTIQMLRFMAEPLIPENLEIASHLFSCDECLKAFNQLQDSITECDYIPEEGDDKAAEQAVNTLLEEQEVLENYFKIFPDYISNLIAQKNAPLQHAYGSPRNSAPRRREDTEPTPILFCSDNPPIENYIYEWRATLYIPAVSSTATDIPITINFPNLPIDSPRPQTLYLHGLELPIEGGMTSVSLEKYLESLENSTSRAIYIKFPGNEKPEYGKIVY